MKKIKNKYLDRVERDGTLWTVLVVLAFLMGVFFPVPIEDERILTIATSLVRFLFCGVAIYFSFALGFYDTLKFKKLSRAGALVFLSSVLLAMSNIPFVELALEKARIVATYDKIILFVVYCVSVAMFEELFFRGLVLPLFLVRFKNMKNGAVLAIVASSILFALVHIFNLLAGAGVASVILQVGYTFLVGLLCGALFYVTKSIAYPIITHLIYNLGGLLLSFNIINGSIFTPLSIIIMASVSVLCTITCTLAVLKQQKQSKIL